MPEFAYEARNAQGGLVEGVLNCPDRGVAIRQIEQLAKEIDFFGMMKQPAIGFVDFANNHGIHHRGQLAAYLRAMGSTVPSIYGGSADEPFQGA